MCNSFKKILFSWVVFSLLLCGGFLPSFDLNMKGLSGFSDMTQRINGVVDMTKKLDKLHSFIDINKSRFNTPIELDELYSRLKCYKFDRSNFDETFDTPHDILVSYFVDEEDPEQKYRFLHITPFPYDLNVFPLDMECYPSSDKNLTVGQYECSYFRDGQVIQMFDNETIYLQIDYAPFLSYDRSKLYIVSSKKPGMVKGKEVTCQPEKPHIIIEGLQKESPKKRLATSISIPDTIINRLDYSGEFAIAVGEAYAPSNRNDKFKYGEEIKMPIVLRTRNNGKTWEKLSHRTLDDLYNAPELIKEVKVLDPEHIVLLTKYTVFSSKDGGETWYKHGLSSESLSLQEIDGILCVVLQDYTVVVSNNKGEQWHSSTIYQEENITDLSLPPLSFFQKPTYKVDYQSGEIIVQHSKKECNGNTLDMPLTYRASKSAMGIVGRYWSLAIESYIDHNNTDELVFFDAKTNSYNTYRKHNQIKDLFLYKTKEIHQTKEGYFIDCDGMRTLFNKQGKLISFIYDDYTYEVVYRKNRPYQIMKKEEGAREPYMSFHYMSNGIMIEHHTYHKKLRLLTDSQGRLIEMLYGNKRVFSYKYLPDGKGSMLMSVKGFLNNPLLDLTYEQEKNNIKTVVSYLDSSVPDRQVVEYLFNHIENRLITTVSTSYDKYAYRSLENYYFEYRDHLHKHLSLTSNSDNIFGFDNNGFVNYYDNGVTSYKLTYDTYGKVNTSNVTVEGKTSVYRYFYTPNEKHLITKVVTPESIIEMIYDKQDKISTLKVGWEVLSFTYTQNHKLLKIVLKDKGELRIVYDKQGKEVTQQALSYVPSIQVEEIVKLIEKVIMQFQAFINEGLIDKYPSWL